MPDLFDGLDPPAPPAKPAPARAAAPAYPQPVTTDPREEPQNLDKPCRHAWDDRVVKHPATKDRPAVTVGPAPQCSVGGGLGCVTNRGGTIFCALHAPPACFPGRRPT